jgi:hypothetical protein
MGSTNVSPFPGPSDLSRFALPLDRFITHITNKTPNKVEGYVDTGKLEIGVVVYVLGVNLDQFYGNLTEGLIVKLNLFIIQGEIKLYLQDVKEVKEVWIKVNANVLGIGLTNLDQKVIAL